MSAFGFTCTAYAGPETGVRDKASYVLEQGDDPLRRVAARSTPTRRSPTTSARHGDGVHDLAWLVDDADAAFDAAVARGAPQRARAVGRDRRARHAASSPRSPRTARRCTRSSTARRYRGDLLEPGYAADEPADRDRSGPPVGLVAHRPRRRQRREGPARRLGRASTAT